MALPVTGVWEIQTTGSDTNGGLYDPSVASAGLDYTQGTNQTTFSYTDAVIGATTTQATSAARPFVANDVGNTVHWVAGGGWTGGWFNIRSVAAGVATFDRSLGTTASISGTGTLGGAMASPGAVAGLNVAGNTIYQKNGTYTITTSSSNVSNGLVNPTGGGGTAPTIWVGYSTNRTPNNTDTAPIITVSGSISSNYIFGTQLNNSMFINNLIIDGASQTTTGGMALRQACTITNCIFRNCTFNAGLLFGNGSCVAFNCRATGNSVVSFRAPIEGIFIGCEAYSNTASGFDDDGGGIFVTWINCLSYNNSGATSHGFLATSSGSSVTNCVAYGNGKDGFHCANQFGIGGALLNCIAEGNSGVGFFTVANNSNEFFINCAAYNNTGGVWTSAATPAAQYRPGFVTNTTGSFFVNAASANFALNNTANQGALARATGYPGTYPRGLTVGYADIGGAQHQDTGGSSGTVGYASA